MQTITTYSSHRPLDIDEVTSPTTTYVNDKIRTKSITNEDGVIETQYVYRTRKYSKEEWANLEIKPEIEEYNEDEDNQDDEVVEINE